MKFIDKQTGNTLEPKNEFVIEQYKLNTDRYELMLAPQKPKDNGKPSAPQKPKEETDNHEKQE